MLIAARGMRYLICYNGNKVQQTQKPSITYCVEKEKQMLHIAFPQML